MTLPWIDEPIRADVLDRPIEGIGLSGRTLRGEIGRDVVLLAFLRHFG